MEIKKLKPRLYQEKIFHTATKKNTLVIIPTGLGKTLIALMLAIHRLKKYPNSKVLFLAPTKPLCKQHYSTFSNNLDSEKILTTLTGAIAPDERRRIWNDSDIIFATPQTIANDLINGRIELEKISLIIFDEAHRAVGDYDYVFLAKNYVKNENAKILALTASPGSDKEYINKIRKNLYINAVEIRHENSPDVSPYVEKRDIKKVFIDFPENLKELKELFEISLRKRLSILKNEGIIETIDLQKIRKSELLRKQSKTAGEARQNGDFALMKYVSEIAACIKILHCLELLQTQGIKTLSKFFEKLKGQYYKVKATKGLLNDSDFKEAMKRTFELGSMGIEHPKFEKLPELIEPESKTIVFTNYRNTVKNIMNNLKKYPEIHPIKFIGQKKGMSQKEQIKTLEKFKKEKYNVLVSSSIGEEGLDIPEVKKVIFFEPIPSALRTIQRRGRTARRSPGEVILLITKGTIDEKYYWVSFHKERKMNNALKEIKKDTNNPQRRLVEFEK